MIYDERRSTQLHAAPLIDTLIDEDIQNFSRYKVQNNALLATMQMLTTQSDLASVNFQRVVSEVPSVKKMLTVSRKTIKNRIRKEEKNMF